MHLPDRQVPVNQIAEIIVQVPKPEIEYVEKQVFAAAVFGRGDDTVGNPHRARISQFELFELILLSTIYKLFSIEQFEPTVSQSTVSSPLPKCTYVTH